MVAPGIEPLDGGDLAADRRRDGRDARANGAAVEVDSARPALRDAAPVLRPGEVQRLAQDPQQRHLRGDIDLLRFAVHIERQHGVLLRGLATYTVSTILPNCLPSARRA